MKNSIFSRILKDFKDIYNTFFAMKELRRTSEAYRGKTIVINTVRVYSTQLYEELYYALLLATRGYKVHVLLDNGILEHWDAIQENENSDELTVYKSKWYKKAYQLFIKELIIKVYKHHNIKIQYYSEILKIMNISFENVVLETKEIGHAKTSVRRFFQAGEYDESINAQINYYNKSLQNAKIAKIVGAYIVEQIKPNLFLTSHAIYSTWGVCHSYVKKHGISAVTYLGHAYRPGYTIFTNSESQLLSEDSNWMNFKTCSLKDDMISVVKDYFDKRVNIKASDNQIYFKDDYIGYDKIIKKPNSLTYAVFPNVIWDSDTEEKHINFDNIIDWLVSTVNAFRESENQLVIRFHPSEATLFLKSKKLEAVLADRIPDLTSIKNIYLISSEEKINTYKLLKENVDIGIVYDGMLALELPYMNIPVISCGKSRYYQAGFSYEPENKSEYIEWLHNGNILIEQMELNKKNILKNLYRFTFWYIFSSGVLNPLYLNNRAFNLEISKEKSRTYHYKYDDNTLNLIKSIEKYIR